MTARVVISFEDGPMIGRSFAFTRRDVFVLGRDVDCHVSVPDDPYLSRHHFALEIAPPLVVLRDLNSRNGTLVNGRKVGGRSRASEKAGEVPLRDRDVVRAGRSSLRIRVRDDDPPSIAEIPHALDRSTKTESLDDPRRWAPGYELIEELGHGASGATWLARTDDGRMVALKMVQLALDSEDVNRLRVFREIDLLRSLEHPNIVRLLDAGDAAVGVYIALEHCAGGSLVGLLERRKRLTWDQARPIALGILRGLAFAHRQGVVHRDVKPSNVLLAKAGSGWVAKVGDFGLAKVVDASGSRSGVTVTGSTAGTLEFMPREQLLEFRTLRPVSDVWSAAATIYCLLAGRPPRRRGQNDTAIQTVLEGDAIPLRDVGVDVPDAVCEVVERALSVRPDDRYPTGSEAFEALSAAG